MTSVFFVGTTCLPRTPPLMEKYYDNVVLDTNSS